MSSDGPQYPQYPGQDPGESQPPPGPPLPPPPPPGQAPPAYGQTPPPPLPPPAQGQKTNDLATWSLILGIVGMLCCGLFTGIPAIILAVQAKRQIALSDGQQSGAGMATAGLVLGIIATVLSVIGALLFMVGLMAGSPPV